MKGFDFIKIRPESTAYSNFNMGNEMVSSLDFAQIVPFYVLDTVARDKINLRSTIFGRLAPLPLPTYGTIHFKHACIHVPYSSLIPEYDAFRSSSSYDRGFKSKIRTMTQIMLDKYIINSLCVSPNSSLDAFVENYGRQPDFTFTFVDAGGANLYYTGLTNRGRYLYKVFNCLGYVYGTNVSYAAKGFSATSYESGPGAESISLLPLLAFIKAFNDNIQHPQHRASSQCALFLRDFYTSNVPYVTTDGSVVPGEYDEFVHDLNLALDEIFPIYENDYFTSAWKYPNAPINQESNNSSSVLTLNTSNFSPFYNNDTNKPIKSSSDTTSQPADVIHNYQQNTIIDRLHKFILRNNLAGSNAVEKILSRFGVTLPTKSVNYSEVISTGSSPIQIGDITAMTEYAEQPLGSYAGKGILNDQSINCKYDVKQDGFFMVLCWLDVRPYYLSRADAHIYHTKPLHFYNEMFDGLQGQPIRLSEFGTIPMGSIDVDNNDNQVFGYCNSYDEYRFKLNKVTGDMALLNRFPDAKQWYLYRDIFKLRKYNDFAMSTNLLAQTTQYDYIFNDQNNDADHFYLNCLFDNQMMRPIKSFKDSCGLSPGHLEMMRNGSHI
ncbi:major capsid protein [Capybara microvirus Cap3_SP_352]|nr:major capsid protein [Capybara microvirus Cap3_SP_352]